MNRKTIDQVRAYAEELGYRVRWEADLLDISGEISLLIQGWGEEYEVHFKLNPKTSYLRWDRAGLVHDYSISPIQSWTAFQQALKEMRELGLSQGLKPYDKSEEEE